MYFKEQGAVTGSLRVAKACRGREAIAQVVGNSGDGYQARCCFSEEEWMVCSELLSDKEDD